MVNVNILYFLISSCQCKQCIQMAVFRNERSSGNPTRGVGKWQPVSKLQSMPIFVSLWVKNYLCNVQCGGEKNMQQRHMWPTESKVVTMWLFYRKKKHADSCPRLSLDHLFKCYNEMKTQNGRYFLQSIRTIENTFPENRKGNTFSICQKMVWLLITQYL